MAQQGDSTHTQDDPDEAARAQGEKIGKGLGFGCLGLVAVFVIGIASCTAMSTGAGGDDDPELQRIGAVNACEDWVRDQLKAPSTADFTGTTATGTGPWVVTGEVDAQNSFGAQIRTSWSCDVRLEGDTFRGRATLSQ